MRCPETRTVVPKKNIVIKKYPLIFAYVLRTLGELALPIPITDKDNNAVELVHSEIAQHFRVDKLYRVMASTL